MAILSSPSSPSPSFFLLAAISSSLMLLRLVSGLDLITFTESDTNAAVSPCADTTVQLGDGFTFGLAFSPSNSSFFINGTQHSPCDKLISNNLTSLGGHLSLFRPKVDQISLLTINESYLDLNNDKFLVAFAGSKYAAVSFPHTVLTEKHIITSFTLVLDFSKGRLQTLLWKSYGCSNCKGNSGNSSSDVCVNGQDCAIPLASCKKNGGKVDCSISFQLSFSGSDKYHKVFNSWYEIANLRQYSLYGLYSNLKDSLTSEYNKYF